MYKAPIPPNQLLLLLTASKQARCWTKNGMVQTSDYRRTRRVHACKTSQTQCCKICHKNKIAALLYYPLDGTTAFNIFLHFCKNWLALISVSLVLSQTPANTARPRIRGLVRVRFPAFAGTHCASLHRDGQAEFNWVADYIPRWIAGLHVVTYIPVLHNRARLSLQQEAQLWQRGRAMLRFIEYFAKSLKVI